MEVQKRNEYGFSLFEICIMLAIIGILAAVAIPNYIAFKEKTNNAISDNFHVFPVQHRTFFKKAGVDVDNYILDTRSHHATNDFKKKTYWNITWNKFVAENPNTTQESIMLQMDKMLVHNGIKTVAWFENYKTGKKTDIHILTSNLIISLFLYFGKFAILFFGNSVFSAIIFLTIITAVCGVIFFIPLSKDRDKKDPIIFKIGFLFLILISVFGSIGVAGTLFLTEGTILAVALSSVIGLFFLFCLIKVIPLFS